MFFGTVSGLTIWLLEGTSVEELKASFSEAIEDYLETCKNLGKSPDKTYKGVLNVRVSSDLHKKAVAIASQYDITLNDFVTTALKYAVEHDSEIVAK